MQESKGNWTDVFMQEPRSIKLLTHILETTPATELKDLIKSTPIEDDLEDDDDIQDEWSRADDRYDDSRYKD